VEVGAAERPIDRARLAEEVAAGGGEVPQEVLDDFLARMDDDYFSREEVADVAVHIRMAAELTSSRPARVAVTPRGDDSYDIAVVAYDYFAEFAVLCGVLTAQGLDIVSGHVHTFAAAPPPPPRPGGRGRRPPPAAPSKIVDVFRVRRHDPGGAPPTAAALEDVALELLGLVAEGRAAEARERLNRRLVESLGSLSPRLADVSPAEIRFDNQSSAVGTVMNVRGSDAPAFLYALANALSMRNVYVHAVFIESVDGEARDRFVIGRRHGGKIESDEELETLRLAVGIIQRFTHFLPWAPDPALALRDFDQFLDRLLDRDPQAATAFSSAEGLQQMARLLGSSAFLWEDVLRLKFERLLPVLNTWRERRLRTRQELSADLRRRVAAAASPDDEDAAIHAFEDEELLLADLRRLLDPDTGLERFEAALSDLAEVLLEEATAVARRRLVHVHGTPRLRDGRECFFAAFGLGKFGGRELGFASDLELLFVYGGPGQTEGSGVENGELYERLVRSLETLIPSSREGIFRMDLRLRPHGSKGPLASPLGAVRSYYRPGGDAAPFERQALLKLRFIAGDPDLGAEVEAIRDAFVWSGEPWNRHDALHLRDRQARELVPLGRVSVKHSRGGLVDVEYAVQYLQLLHGRDHPDLRVPSTLLALERLAKAGLVDAGDERPLREAYLFWRRVADALRMVKGQASDLLLPEDGSEEMGLLARRLGYTGDRWSAAAVAVAAAARRHAAFVRSYFDRTFRPGTC
jgi:glutamate-ammonia-ligase adenylyltransferase